jgi:hypothetical protein
MKVLIGKRAAELYQDREQDSLSTWEFLCEPEEVVESELEGFNFVPHLTTSPQNPTNQDIYDYCNVNHGDLTLQTPFGLAIVAPPEILAVLGYEGFNDAEMTFELRYLQAQRILDKRELEPDSSHD